MSPRGSRWGLGLAGEVIRAGGAHRVDERSVRAVIDRAVRPIGSVATLDTARLAGAFVGGSDRAGRLRRMMGDPRAAST